MIPEQRFSHNAIDPTPVPQLSRGVVQLAKHKSRYVPQPRPNFKLGRR
jgi:hypothetical protein